MNRRAVLISLLLSCATAAHADVKLPTIFGDHMVLQRGKPNTFWGWAKPGEEVHVDVGGHQASAKAGEDGRWQVRVDPPEVGGPYTVKIDGGSEHAELKDVLAGDVWLCGGQSNMEMGITQVNDADREIQNANPPQVRLYIVGHQPTFAPAAVPASGQWKVCSPESVKQGGWGGFSAVAYFFGTALNEKLHVPIGLVEDAVGGTSVETWTNAESLRKVGGYDAQLAEAARLQTRGGPVYGNYIMPWYDEYDVGQKEHWEAPAFDDSKWKTVHVPTGAFADLGVPDQPAVCWFRKEVTLPNPLPGAAEPGKIELGVIERMDTVYINGHWVGASAWVENPRAYDIPAGVLKPGPNVIAVRVLKTKPDGGFKSPANLLQLKLGDDKTAIPLAGAWKGAVSVDAKPPHPLPMGFENWPIIPTVLYNGMLKPVTPLAVTGAIWYQGEANWQNAYAYRKLLPAMIQDWRQAFAQGDFPFYIVQLPKFNPHKDQPGDDAWAELRESQAVAAKTAPNAGLVVTIDTGDPNNIHPKDKRIVGDRLAALALAEHYGQKVPHAGPTFTTAEHVPGGLRLHFDHADGGLVAKASEPKEFSVAGADRKFHWARAKIEGDTIVVSAPDVPEPQAARYAWQGSPQATLFNGAGLPAGPFRTDDWPLSTQHEGR
jgi:sialate O-acetylesterase